MTDVKIDANVFPIVKYMKEYHNGVVTVGSCGGHKNNKPYQAKEGYFYVDFIGEHDEAEHFVRFLFECDSPLEIVLKSTIVSKISYRLQGKLEDGLELIPE